VTGRTVPGTARTRLVGTGDARADGIAEESRTEPAGTTFGAGWEPVFLPKGRNRRPRSLARAAAPSPTSRARPRPASLGRTQRARLTPPVGRRSSPTTTCRAVPMEDGCEVGDVVATRLLARGAVRIRVIGRGRLFATVDERGGIAHTVTRLGAS
jgi:hypothetical protein